MSFQYEIHVSLSSLLQDVPPPVRKDLDCCRGGGTGVEMGRGVMR